MRLLVLILLSLISLLPAGVARAQAQGADPGEPELRFFRIGSGETSGTYYAVAGVIAAAISNPPGGVRCDEGGACGVPGLLASALSSEGSVQNIQALRDGKLESAMVQADIAHAAQSGGRGWQGRNRADKLRAIAALYPEAIHLIARADSGIGSISDLAGKRVSISQAGSGTRIDAQLVLQAAGIPDARLQLSELSTDEAARQLRAGELDAFFMVGGWPVSGLTALASQTDVVLLPIAGPLADRLIARHPFFRRETIPAGTYAGQAEPVETLSVAALWLTTEDQPEALIHDITRVLWNDYTQRMLRLGHPVAHAISAESALAGISIPLHPGAEAYYQGAGLLKR
ncbi:TAXI family TRAP transporter solute-binding subunit [uncultured Paracoccus sp.]|uniref:TAXI family TRAP transporter solute-binding subunit n=1 Tax=uncultured Paracoccus sp. TaxID=189685 RepID=UPI002629D031|nr:TAXI family TRAP transporter solute-binding subunit [uncultured Paracoccus sp.]